MKDKKDGLTKQQFKIQGMHCVGCAITIDGVVEDLQGVKSATTHYARQILKVEYDAQKINEQAILAAISEAGYAGSSLEKT
jgi:copper chaperone CopZ